MQFKEIVAVTGLGGLYQLLTTKSDGAIVRSLGENATKFISSRQHNVTPLETIEIYTTGDNVRLLSVMKKICDSEATRPGAKAGNDEIRGFFRQTMPDIDEERVYTSDMKKMLKWYEILSAADLLDFSELSESNPSAEEGPAESASAEAGATEGGTAMPAEGEAQVAEHQKEDRTDLPLVEDGAQAVKKTRAKKVAATDKDDAQKPAKKTAAKKNAGDAEEDSKAS